VLESVFQQDAVDFFILMSSISSQLAPAGQVDYAAANAFLDAFARSRSTGGSRFVSIQWPRWTDVGMASETSNHVIRYAGLPLLGYAVRESDSEAEYVNVLRLERDWIVGEHRLTGGAGLFPGTGYIEMVSEVLARRGSTYPLSIRNLNLVAPLRVEPGGEQKIRFRLRQVGLTHRFSVAAWNEVSSEWTECALGEVETTSRSSPSHCRIEEVRLRCNVRELRFDGYRQNQKQAKHIDFGQRWKNLECVYLGRGEALSVVELSAEYTTDLVDYRVHPAILDMATGSAMLLIDRYASTDELYIPISYGSIMLHGPLPAKCYSHIRAQGKPTIKDPVATFDISVLDNKGIVVAEIRDFALRRVSNPSTLSRLSSGAGTVSTAEFARNGLSANGTSRNTNGGITSTEGAAAFVQLVASSREPNVIVFPSGLALLDAITKSVGPDSVERQIRDGDNDGKLTDEVEVRLARWWEELLGVKRVGRLDNFFDLGGESLTGVRLLAKLRKTYGIDLKVAALFEAPTIEQLALLVHGEATPKRFSSVAPIRTHKSVPPLSFPHRLGGKVLGFIRRHTGI
jgi:aryl carrier-like protein